MPDAPIKDQLTNDHAELLDTAIVRQYFQLFEVMAGYLPNWRRGGDE